jgi:hypothetical protein
MNTGDWGQRTFRIHFFVLKVAQSWFPLICVKLPSVPLTGRSGELMNVMAGWGLITLLDARFCPIGQYSVLILLLPFKKIQLMTPVFLVRTCERAGNYVLSCATNSFCSSSCINLLTFWHRKLVFKF